MSDAPNENDAEAGASPQSPDEVEPSVVSSTESPAVNESPTIAKSTWRAPSVEGDIVEIEELPPAPPRPAKKGWRAARAERQAQQSDSNNMDGEEGNTASESRPSVSYNTLGPQNLGSKPKSSNMSLLSSAVAHATLERCLLGVNGGEAQEGSTIKMEGGEKGTSSDGIATEAVDFSKQCKPGHEIDILELRRLSSRGVPDEPPEVREAKSKSAEQSADQVRARAVSAPAVTPSEGMGGEIGEVEGNISSPHSSSSGGMQSLGGPHRSYRPLVWRVLLGYLPPQTSQWNEAMARDRKLYDTLVRELFSATCPAPHDVCDEEELRKPGEQQNEVHSSKDAPGAKFVIDSDDDDEDEATDTTGVATESTADDGPTPPPPASTPVSPGLLSARMQQEWVRGMEQGQESVFGSPQDNKRKVLDGGEGLPPLPRLTPLCAMNTPRTRIRKEAFRRAGEDADEDAESDEKVDETTGTSLTTNEEEELSGQLKKSLLDGDNIEADEDENMDTVDIAEEQEGNADESKGPSQPSDSPGSKLTRSISITNTASEDEGVELCRQSSRDAGDQGPKTDEEENLLLLDEIRKDVIRTHPDLRFFLEPNEDLGQKRYAALERILFVWAKLNKGVRYVQGMNEIVGTLYFVLAHDSNEDWAREAEADTYFLFNALMVEMRDVFVPDLDDADTGIHGRINNMITLLSLHDPEVRCHLDSVGIDPSFYSVRWLTTLLSREFLLPDTIRLWDSMFASTHKDNFLRYVAVTMVMVIRDELLAGDFSDCLRLLQAYPPTNLDRLLESSRALWIYESQITLACHKGGISLGHALRSIAPPPALVMAYGLPGGVAPPIGEQVRQAGKQGLRVARGAANGASTTVASAGRSFWGNAVNYWRAGSSGETQAKKEVRKASSAM
ncbi:hypothetical protein ACHAXT_002217 [Thalassiosira profunda]